MAYSKEDLLKKLEGSEVVGGNVIHGTLADRVFVGKINEEGVFYITPEGEERLAAAEAASKKPAKKSTVAEVVEEALADDTPDSVEDLQAAEEVITAAISKKRK